MRKLTLAAVLLATTAQAQFQIQDSHSTASLRGIHSVGNGIAWASGTEGTVLRTTDEGATWQRCTTPPDADKLDFRGIQAFDQNTAIVMSSGKGDLSRLYKTTDACKSWKLVFTNPDKDGFWDAIQFVDQEHGYLLGDPVNNSFQVWKTRDGGNTWDQNDAFAHSVFRADPLTQGAFAASNSGLWVSSAISYVAFGTGGTAGAMIYSMSRSTAAGGAGGGSHRRIPIGNETQSSGVFSLCFHYEDGLAFVGVAIGGDYTKPESTTGTAAFTIDGGKLWESAKIPPHGYRSSVAYDPTQKLWITVGPNGTDISRDDGKNWTALKPSAQDTPDADKNWNALSLPFVVGPKGRIGKLHPEALKP